MRDCGICQLCCWLYPVPEMDKPGHTNCKHQCEQGCAIHDQDRPPICTDFCCCWSYFDWWPVELRPDKCNLIFTRQGFLPNGKYFFVAARTNPYAHMRNYVRNWVDRLVRRGHIILFTYQGEEGYEYAGYFDNRRYPGCNDNLLMKWYINRNREAYRRQNEWVASHT